MVVPGHNELKIVLILQKNQIIWIKMVTLCQIWIQYLSISALITLKNRGNDKRKTLIFHKKFLPLIILWIPIIKEAQSNDKLQNENAYTDENFCYDQPPLETHWYMV